MSESKKEFRDDAGKLFPEHRIELESEIEHNGIRITEVVLHEPTAVEVMRAEIELKNMTPETIRRYQIRLVSEVSKHKVPLIERLPIQKLNEASRYLQAFVEAGPETGES